ncbi:hypothetical protein D5086_007455 [Populus alba]|uniref:Uncharacterized protein n=1 Tax=Populus alba TaxID=43335 RepID=A0ACC4CNK2_POPAL
MEDAAAAAASSAVVVEEERLDVLNKIGEVHRDGDYHRAVHVWIYSESTQELLLQRRADCKDSWPGQWDISSAGHISAGDSSLVSAQRELQEELGISLPKDAFELIFIYLQECVINDGKFINNEFNDVYLVTTVDPIPLEAFILQETEVSAVKYISFEEYRSLLVKEDPDYVPYEVDEQYGQLFEIIRRRCTENTVARSLSLQKQLCLSNTDRKTLGLLIKAAKLMDEIFYLQVLAIAKQCECTCARSRLIHSYNLQKLLVYRFLPCVVYLVTSMPSHFVCLPFSFPLGVGRPKVIRANKVRKTLSWETRPVIYSTESSMERSCLDENEAFLATTDSAIKLLPEATKPVSGWKGLEYKAAFPMLKPPGANFYPPDMDKKEFKLWNDSLTEKEQNDAMGFFTVIKRHSEFSLDSSSPNHAVHGTNHLMTAHDLYSVPYSKEYNSFLRKAAELLHEAGDLAGSPR